MGLCEEGTQRALLTEKDLTFARAVELAVARESAAKDAREFLCGILTSKDEMNSVKVNSFAKSSPKPNNNNSITKAKSEPGEKKKA